MHNDDHLLDQFLKNKVEGASFDFKEEYWLKASKMLDEEDKKKRRPFFWRLWTLLVVVLAVGAGTFILSNKNNPKNADKQLVVRQSSKTDVSTGDVMPSAIPGDKSFTTDRPDITHEGNSQEAASVAGSKAVVINTTSESKTNATSKTKPRSETATAGVMAPKEIITDGAQPGENNVSNTPDNKQNIPLDKKEKLITNGKSVRVKNNKRVSVPPLAATLKNESKQTGKLSGEKNADADHAVLLHGKKMQPVDTHIFVSRPPRDESVYNPRYQFSLRNYVSERIDSVTVLTFKPLPDEKPEIVIPSPDLIKDTAANLKRKNAMRLFIAGGANVNKGFKGNTNTSVAWGAAPYLNLGAEKNINNKISLAAQIGFTYFNALNVQKKVVHYKYSFGYDSTQLSVEYRRMYQLVLPLTVTYQLNKFHNVLASLGASYVMNTFSKVTDQGNSSVQTGYQDGINPFDLFAQLGYQYTLTRKFAFQAFLQQGFLSATKKDYFNINTANTQTRISLGLKYYFKRNGN